MRPDVVINLVLYFVCIHNVTIIKFTYLLTYLLLFLPDLSVPTICLRWCRVLMYGMSRSRGLFPLNVFIPVLSVLIPGRKKKKNMSNVMLQNNWSLGLRTKLDSNLPEQPQR